MIADQKTPVRKTETKKRVSTYTSQLQSNLFLFVYRICESKELFLGSLQKPRVWPPPHPPTRSFMQQWQEKKSHFLPEWNLVQVQISWVEEEEEEDKRR